MNGQGTSKPKYEELRGNLEEYIASGLSPHDALPSERELMQRFSVSRMTVREAIARLAADGLVYRVRGAGTFVADPATISKSPTLTSFSEDIRARNMEPGTQCLLREIVPADPFIARDLAISIGEDLLHLERLRTADGQPMCLENVWLPISRVGEIDADEESLYEVLAKREHAPEYAHQTIRASTVTGEMAKMLGVEDGAAAIVVSRTTFDGGGLPVERGVSAYRADRYDFQMTVRRRQV